MIQTDHVMSIQTHLPVQFCSWMPTWNLWYLRTLHRPYTQNTRLLHSSWNRPFQSPVYDAAWLILLSLIYVTSYTWLHGLYCVHDQLLDSIPVWMWQRKTWSQHVYRTQLKRSRYGVAWLWSIHCTPNCSPTHQHCFNGNKNLSALSVHGNKMPVHPKPETNLRLKNSMFQASPTSSFWWLINIRLSLAWSYHQFIFHVVCPWSEVASFPGTRLGLGSHDIYVLVDHLYTENHLEMEWRATLGTHSDDRWHWILQSRCHSWGTSYLSIDNPAPPLLPRTWEWDLGRILMIMFLPV